jgi:hypothetical protein
MIAQAQSVKILKSAGDNPVSHFRDILASYNYGRYWPATVTVLKISNASCDLLACTLSIDSIVDVYCDVSIQKILDMPLSLESTVYEYKPISGSQLGMVLIKEMAYYTHLLDVFNYGLYII